MNILNLTPHPVNILKKDCTTKQRFGKILLRPECSLEDALITSIQPETTPLNITPDVRNKDLICDNLPFYSPICSSHFGYESDASLPNNSPGSCPFLFDSKFNMADVIIVSQLCATYINAIIPFKPYNQDDEWRRMILLDKFYIPFKPVYPNRIPNSSSQGYSGRKPIGVLGLQKVIYQQDINSYATAIDYYQLHVSIPALCSVAFKYINQHPAQRCYESALQTVNNYLVQHGYSPYPELYPRQY